jgi:DNA-binding response OmpR family regulator
MAIFKGTASSSTFTTHILQKGPFLLNREKRQASYDGEHLKLSPINFDYLWTLLLSAPDPVSYEKLVSESIGFRLAITDPRQATRWRIQQLRQVIESNPQRPNRILSVPGYGYRIRV